MSKVDKWEKSQNKMYWYHIFVLDFDSENFGL